MITEWHKSASVCMENMDGSILAVSRKDDFDDFSLPGGKMDEQDKGDYLECAIREVLEETGYEFDRTRLNPFSKYNPPVYEGFHVNHKKPHILYYCKVFWIPRSYWLTGNHKPEAGGGVVKCLFPKQLLNSSKSFPDWTAQYMKHFGILP